MSYVTAPHPKPDPADLEQLARLLVDDPTCVPPPVVDAYLAAIAHAAHPTATARRDAFADYVEAVRVRDSIECGLLDYTAVDPELTCPDKQDAAYDIAAERANQARRRLTCPSLLDTCPHCDGAGCIGCDVSGAVDTPAARRLVAFLRREGVAL